MFVFGQKEVAISKTGKNFGKWCKKTRKGGEPQPKALSLRLCGVWLCESFYVLYRLAQFVR
jgi:hypothetical protein